MQQRQDLKEFTEIFEETKEELTEQITHTSRRNASVGILILLILLNAAFFTFQAYSLDIKVFYTNWYITQHQDEMRDTITQYTDASDYIGLYYYLHDYASLYDTALSDYSNLYYCCCWYQYSYQAIMHCSVLSDTDFIAYESAQATLSKSLPLFYESVAATQISKYCTDETLAILDDMVALLEIHLETYLDIPAEDIPALLALSEEERTNALMAEVIANEG